MKKNILLTAIILLAIRINLFTQDYPDCDCDYIINKNSKYQLYPEDLEGIGPGKVICFVEDRTIPVRFRRIEGSKENPIIIKNCGGQILIPNLELDSCKHIIITGTGDSNVKYGLRFNGKLPWGFGVSLNGLSSDIELEYLHIGGPESGFGIVAKKDYSGNPPSPLPVFENLIIHDVLIDGVATGNGMYIGETKTPAMEFKHVRIYNNIVLNTGRESVQVGHCNEDVEVYNNFFMNAGILGLTYQGNNLQLGYRTEGLYYNNVLLNAPAMGIIALSNRGYSIFNNYSENNTGMFIDDREDEHEPSPIKVHHNFFYSNIGDQYFQIYNEKTKVMFYNNFVNSDVQLYSKLGYVKSDSLVFENNTIGPIAKLEYNDLYQVKGHYYNMGMGPIKGITHKLNYNGLRQLEIISRDSIFVFENKPDSIFISCVNRTEKPIKYKATGLPSFAEFSDNNNGTATIKFLANTTNLLNSKYIINISVQELNGDSDDIDINVFTNTVSLYENKIDNLKIYPNPASTIINVDIPKNSGYYKYHIVNVKGQILNKGIIGYDSSQITVSNLRKGLYVIIFTNNTGLTKTMEFIKN